MLDLSFSILLISIPKGLWNFVILDITNFVISHTYQIMAAKLKACQEIMPPPHQHHQLQQQRRKQPPYSMSSGVPKSLSPSLKSLNSLNASRASVANDLDDTTPAESSPRKTTAI